MFDIRNRSLVGEVKELLDKLPADFGGGCGIEKAFVKAWLIYYYKMKNTVDIGVYWGRSLFPQALAHKKYTNGKVFGVDPWTKVDAMENDNLELKDMIHEFIEKTDFEKIFKKVSEFNEENGFEKNCVLVRKKSEDAVSQFLNDKIKFDLIHIDGNHDTDFAVKDVNLYLPLLNENGFVILDDISWDSVKPAQKILEKNLSLINLRNDGDNDYAIFWNNKSRCKILFLQFALKYLVRE